MGRSRRRFVIHISIWKYVVMMEKQALARVEHIPSTRNGNSTVLCREAEHMAKPSRGVRPRASERSRAFLASSLQHHASALQRHLSQDISICKYDRASLARQACRNFPRGRGNTAAHGSRSHCPDCGVRLGSGRRAQPGGRIRHRAAACHREDPQGVFAEQPGGIARGLKRA